MKVSGPKSQVTEQGRANLESSPHDCLAPGQNGLVLPTACNVPQWLKQWRPNQRLNLSDFLASRVVFYPGSGTDGQPVQFFGSRHLAHCFIYVDYGITKSFVKQELAPGGHPFAGYDGIARFDLLETDLTPKGWISHFPEATYPVRPQPTEAPYAFLEILQRRNGLTDRHGPERLAILFLCADGVAAYDALFCQEKSMPLFALVLQDHGFGDNWTTFGKGGSLEQVALVTSRSPQLLFVADNTEAWQGYSPVDGAFSDHGGMHGFRRQVWMRSNTTPIGDQAPAECLDASSEPLPRESDLNRQAPQRSARNFPLAADTQDSARDHFFNSLLGNFSALTLVTRLTELCNAYNVRVHHTLTNGGDLRVEVDRPAPSPLQRNVITMIWRPKRGYFACQSLLSPAQCLIEGMPVESVRGNNGVLHSKLNVQPGLHDVAFLAVVEASIRLFREQ